jgi:hypothetical protein
VSGWFDPERLPEYAAGAYDAYLRDPVLVRLATWARLERTLTGDLYARAGGFDVQVVARIEKAQAEGVLVDHVAPLEIFCLVIGMASAWAQSSLTITASIDEPDAVHAARREALAGAVRAAFCR